MVERLFFSKLVTKDLTAIESSRRLFEGVLTVEMKDRQGEITVRDELLKVLPIWIARGGPITDTHSNRVVGQGINFGSTTVTDEKGKSYPAITIQGEIYRDYELDDEIWNAIKSGKYKGLSFGGATKSNRTPIMQKDGSVAYSLKDLEQYEVAVCEEPAVPLALITQHNEIAKAMAGETKDRGDGKMCIRCDRFKCYVDKDSLVKIEDDEDENTQVTVLDEWKHEKHPDTDGKTEGIRTTKGDDTFSDKNGANSPNKDEDAEALENNVGEPQENGATYHGTDKAEDDKAMDKDDDEMLEEADLEEVEKILPALGAAAGAIGRGAAGAARGAAGAARNVGGKFDAALCAGEKIMNQINEGIGSAQESGLVCTCSCSLSSSDKSHDSIESKYTEDGKDQYGNKMPKVMRKKPSETDTAQDKPGTRHGTRQTGMGEVKPSTSNMTPEQLKRRQEGNWNKQSGPKVGGKKIKPGPTVTHDHKTGTTTIDNSTARRGSQGKITIPTERYISNFTSKRNDMKQSFDLLRLLFTVKTGNVNKIETPTDKELRIELDEARAVESGKVSKPKEKPEAGETALANQYSMRNTEAWKSGNDYNTCEVVREYDDEEKTKATGDAPYTEPGRGGFAGREPGKTCDHNESTSIHNVNQPKHVNRPYEDEDAEALKKGMSMVDINNRDNAGRCIGAACAKKPKAKQPLAEPGTYFCEDCGKESESSHAASLSANKNDRAMTANNAEDGINGKMRLDDDPPAEALEKNEKVYDGKDRPGQVTRPNATTQDEDGDYPTDKTKDTGVMDPGSGAGGIRTGSSYDNAQQDTGQKDNPRKVKEEEYSGEEDRGNLNEKYSGEEDTVSGSSTENYNKASIELAKLLFDLKKHI